MRFAIAAVLSAMLFCAAQACHASGSEDPRKQFTREDYMVLNLNRGNDSAGAHIDESLRAVKQAVKDLDRALRQIEQVDKQFAKSKRRPDDRYLAPASQMVKKSLETARQLETELTACKSELKDSIHQALLLTHP